MLAIAAAACVLVAQEPAGEGEAGADPLRRLREWMKAPADSETPAQVRRRLEDLADQAGRLAEATAPGPVRTTCRQVELQSLDALLNEWGGGDEQAERWIGRMRSAARELKSADDAPAAAAGDYWLTLAEVTEINRSTLPPEQRRRQVKQALEAMAARHATGEAGRVARGALDRMTPPFELKPLASSEPDVDRYELLSPHQPSGNVVRVLLPGKLKADPSQLAEDDGYRLLYVLPVERGLESRYGDGLGEILKLDLHNLHDLIVIAPSFSQLPWYADHPDDPRRAQQRYVIESLIPAIDRQFPIRQPRRLLLGFSKSGWGAVSLLLRRPDLFEAAAAWDAPLMVEDIDKYGMKEILGTRDHFGLYALPQRLRESADTLRQRPRLVLTGHGNFVQPMQDAQRLLEDLSIPHAFDFQARLAHRWDSGWVGLAVRLMLGLNE
jgi:esterase/lipase superfamily enzyme